MAVLTLALGGLCLVAAGWFMGYRRANTAVRAAQREAVVLTGRLSDIRAECATAVARRQASEERVERLAQLLASRERQAGEFERERARHGQEFREVSLLAAQVPILEGRAAKAERHAMQRDQLVQRVVELEPFVDELDLRDQYIETLHRQLVQRDERIFALESGVAAVAAGAAGASADSLGAAVPPPLFVADGALGGVSAGLGVVIARKALGQALAGLGVESFGDVACLDESGANGASGHEQKLDSTVQSSTLRAVISRNGA